LLEKEPEERLGHEGADQVKNHVFFEGTNWEAVSKQLNPPPFVPDLTSDVDVSNFDNLFTDEPVLMSTRHVIIYCLFEWGDPHMTLNPSFKEQVSNELQGSHISVVH